jgi:hypothetical protein
MKSTHPLLIDIGSVNIYWYLDLYLIGHLYSYFNWNLNWHLDSLLNKFLYRVVYIYRLLDIDGFVDVDRLVDIDWLLNYLGW